MSLEQVANENEISRTFAVLQLHSFSFSVLFKSKACMPAKSLPKSRIKQFPDCKIIISSQTIIDDESIKIERRKL